MRYSPRRGFPYPVLGQSRHAYPGKKLTVELQARPQQQPNAREDARLVFDAVFKCESATVKGLVRAGKAACSVWVYCSETSLRCLFQADTGTAEVTDSLGLGRLSGKVEFHPLIVAAVSLDLPLGEAHPAYGNGTLPVPAGGPLAVTGPYVVPLRDLSEDSGNIRSLIALAADDELDRGMWEVEYGDTLITLKAHTDTLDEFRATRARPVGRVWAKQALYLPTLVGGVNEYVSRAKANGDSDSERGLLPEEGTTWTGCFTREFMRMDASLEDEDLIVGGKRPSALWVAQRLLHSPLALGLPGLEQADTSTASDGGE